MSQPASPHLLSAAGTPGEPAPREMQQNTSSNELSARPQSSSPTTHQSYEAATPDVNANMLATRVLSSSENDFVQHAAMTLEANRAQLPPLSCYLPGNLTQNVHAFSTSACFASESPCNDIPQHPRTVVSYDDNYPPKYPLEYAPVSSHNYSNTSSSGLHNEVTNSYPPPTFYYSEPSIYATPSLPDTSLPDTTQLGDDYELHYARHTKQEDQAGYYSDMPHNTNFCPPCYEEQTPFDKELPYAQLIHRALLSAPNHTMVLRDIYAWFETYTDKAAHSETRGWQNSIRHNLSMNGVSGFSSHHHVLLYHSITRPTFPPHRLKWYTDILEAFEKVDVPTEATTKGFMWRLTPTALREGVKSTTRYRTKAKRSPNRGQPLPQRQASGAKGGNASRRATSNRRAQRARELSHHGPTSGPRSGPYNGYSSDFREEPPYSSPSSCHSRSDTPYSQISYSPYNVPEDHAHLSPMLGMASHLLPPQRSYTSSPASPATPACAGTNADYDMDVPAESLFAMPSVDQQVDRTSFVEHPVRAHDAASSMDMDELTHHASMYYTDGT